MKPRALVVEDDPLIMPTIKGTLQSMRHRHVWVTNQTDAQETLEREEFDYVLLDLQIPTLPDCGGADIQYGVNLLYDIRSIKGADRLPVIIMTAYTEKCVDITTDLIDGGACGFISKPFHNKGRELSKVIRKAISRRKTTNCQQKSKRFAGGELVFLPDRALLLGVPIISDRNTGQCLMVLRQLGRKSSQGRFVRLSSDDIARQIGASGGVGTILNCICTLRTNIVRRLQNEGVDIGREDVIDHNEQGYFLRDWITVRDDVADASASATAEDGDLDLNKRQAWVLAQIRRGVNVRRADVEEQFGVVAKTARRDLAELNERGITKYVREGRSGYYCLT